MSKQIQESALSFFLIVCGIAILMGMFWLKPVIESQRLLAEQTRINQEKIMKTAEETRAVVVELGYVTAVIAMMENRMIQPADANKMIQESITTIETQSERLGELAKIVNEYRINTQVHR